MIEREQTQKEDHSIVMYVQFITNKNQQTYHKNSCSDRFMRPQVALFMKEIR